MAVPVDDAPAGVAWAGAALAGSTPEPGSLLAGNMGGVPRPDNGGAAPRPDCAPAAPLAPGAPLC